MSKPWIIAITVLVTALLMPAQRGVRGERGYTGCYGAMGMPGRDGKTPRWSWRRGRWVYK